VMRRGVPFVARIAFDIDRITICLPLAIAIAWVK
jgi:hypothetical protein